MVFFLKYGKIKLLILLGRKCEVALKVSQSLAVLEILHAIVGLVKSSPFTTLIQVSCWFITRICAILGLHFRHFFENDSLDEPKLNLTLVLLQTGKCFPSFKGF